MENSNLISSVPSSSSDSLPSRTAQDEENRSQILDLTVKQEYHDLISSLPKRGGYIDGLRMYQGFWIGEGFLPHVMAVQDQFKLRPTDVILATQPKSGTTWLKALVFAIVNRSNYSFAQHPLVSRNPHECLPSLESPRRNQATVADHDMPATPRLLATHIPYSLLPASVADSDCRLVYLCRDPKDVFVSLWHFLKCGKPDCMEFSQAFEMFCEGASPNGPVWDHNLEYWRESLRRPEKVLFLKYEQMKDEPIKSAGRLAEFVGCPFSEEEDRDGVVEEVVRLCSFEKLRSLEVNKSGVGRVRTLTLRNASFFREGRVGSWENHLSRDMAERLDRIVQKKLNGSGLTF